MDPTTWADFLREGHFLSFLYEASQRKYYQVKHRDIAHIEYTWGENISTLSESGPTTIADLEVTVPWTQLSQLIWGVTPQCYVYVQLPTDIERHGLPKRPKHTSNYYTVAHFGMHDSPFDNPSWLTEHFMQRPIDPYIAFTIYNKTPITITPIMNFWVNKMEVEHIGDEEANGAQSPAKPKFADVLDKLCKRLIPCRPITLLPVRAPATTT